MKTEELTSYKLNHDTLEIMAKVKEHYPDQKTILMNLRTISKEFIDLATREITGFTNGQ